MSEIINNGVFDEAIAELRRRSKLTLYQKDFDAWAWDVLRLRNYEKMRNIAHDMLFAPRERTLVKSANGVGKSALVSQLILWVGSVWPEGDTVSIVSAPSIPQLQKVTFKYLKEYHGRVSEKLTARDFKVPGRIDENLGWVSETRSGKIWLATGRKPPDQDAVSMFQGLRSPTGMTYVWFDEAGGMSTAMFTAAEAVQTGDDSRFNGIGNPDNAGTDFQQNFEIKEKAAEYNLHTISAYDTPVFTGERVYPRTPEGDLMEARLLKALTSKRWVAHKSRIWATGGQIVPDYDFLLTQKDIDKGAVGSVGDPDPRYFRRVPRERVDPATGLTVIDEVKWDARGLSKVLGEFPGDSDSAFFPQAVINRAHATEIVEDFSIRPILGVDIARFGQDESVIYLNRGGRARLLASWAKEDTVYSARRIHENAQTVGASEVRIDSVGIGGAVYDMLKNLEEFANKNYILVGVDGSKKSPDPRRWGRARAHNHDQLRTLMVGDGVTSDIDLDIEDEALTEHLLNLTYRFSKTTGAIEITPKDEMRTEMGGSPDRLDALIYSVIDTSSLFLPEAEIQPGDVVLADPFLMTDDSWWASAYPL